MSAPELVRVIVNPAAGHGAGRKQLRRLMEASRELGLKLIVEMTEYPGHATELAREAAEQKVKLVGVMGGDGTVGEAINGLVYSNSILGIVAVGTGNDVARSLGLPLNDPRQSLEVISTGKAIRIDAGQAGGRYFVSVLGIGFPVSVAVEANRVKGVRGSVVFFLAMYKCLLRMKAERLEIKLDDREIGGDFTSLVVQNTPYTGGGLLIAPAAEVDDGLLDVVAVGRIGKIDLMMNLPKLYKGRHLKHPQFSHSQCERLEIRSKEKLPAMFDGDLFGHTPLEIEIKRGALRVIVKQ